MMSVMVRVLLFLMVICYTWINALSFAKGVQNGDFYIRHHSGKCVEFDGAKKVLVLKSVCRDKFRWSAGSRFTHVSTKGCMVPNTAMDGNTVSLTRCTGTNTLFRQTAINGTIQHLKTKECLAPEGNASIAAENTRLVIKSECKSEKARFWLVSEVMYVIKHFSGLCWVYDKINDEIKLQKTYVCDRFKQENSKNLKHVATGKCVTFSNNYLRLTQDCNSTATQFDLGATNLLQHPSTGHCIHPHFGLLNPTPGTKLDLYPACNDEDRIRFYFYDERSILNVKLTSESCSEYPEGSDCTICKSHVIVNGYNYSLSTRGINVVVFDYRSGIFEHRSTYDVFNNDAARNDLALFLNSIASDKILFMVAKDSVQINHVLADALRKQGVSSSFAKANLANGRLSMTSITHTGKKRKSWEATVDKVGGQGMSVIEKVIYLFHDFQQRDECSYEMGMRNGAIHDSHITAPSVYDGSGAYYPGNARLDGRTGWCSAVDAPLSHYLQIDLGVRKMLTGIAIQGEGTDGWHTVSKFNIQHSMDGYRWKYMVDHENLKMVFEGAKKILHDARVNWFPRSFTRYVRILPLERISRSPPLHCIRIELFGCHPVGPIFTSNLVESESRQISESYSDQLSFFGIAPLSKQFSIGVSSASDNTTLSQNFNQYLVNRMEGNITSSNGTVYETWDSMSMKQNNMRKIPTSAETVYHLLYVDYYSSDLTLETKISDTGKKNGHKSWNVYSYESEEKTVIVCKPMAIMRRSKDEGNLVYKINSTAKTVFKDGDILTVNVSINNSQEINNSSSNVYDLNLFLYYESHFLSLMSVENIEKEQRSLAPTWNSTSSGLVHIHTDTLWLLNNHFIQLNFQFKLPKQFLISTKCNGALLIDFSYRTNLLKFGGKVNTTLQKRIPYNCSINNARSKGSIPETIKVPGFSIIYDDVNNDIYICLKRTSNSNCHHSHCFLQRSGKLSWLPLQYIGAVVGVDTLTKTLYGLDSNGKGYIKSMINFSSFVHINENDWTSIQNEAQVRKSKTINDAASLPSSPSADWILPSSANQVWTATKTGLKKKRLDQWVTVVSFL